ncbi:response regulator [Paenibacillus sp. HJGM_3]|uniref:response regulator transcription factor n=1 Tax=Paenibacillus sp. HJGM_3 TaxID=3379816 RepID=UPI003859BAA3
MIHAIVVEDEYFVRLGFIAAMPWEDFGIRIVGEAVNGKQAIELMERMKVDLVITDLAMPVMNGFDLMRHVREHYPNVHLVVLTCHEDFKYIRDAMRYGALDYLIKTEIEGDTMQESLRRIVQRISKSDVTNRFPGAASANDGQEVADWSEEDGIRLQQCIDRWLPLYWVVSDAEFELLQEQLRELQPPLQELRKSVHYLLVEWSRMPGIGSMHDWSKRAERLQTQPDWESYFREIRQLMRRQLRMAQYPEDVVIRILQVKEMMKSEMDAKISQSYFAEKMKLSRGYFSSSFKDIVGTSFPDYLKALRIARAKTLLTQTAKSVADIAEECGIPDHRYFSKQFREETGLLPSEYRSSRNSANQV